MKPYVLALLTALIWGIVPVLEKTGLVRVQPHIGLYARSFGVALALVLYSLFFVSPREAVRGLDLRSFLFLASGGFLASFVAQFVFYHSLKSGDASRMTAVAGSYPLVTFVLACLVLGESPSVTKVAGIALVVAGLILLR